MTAVRLAISVFVVILLTLVVLGWRWTGAHQPEAQALASQVVLGISGLAGAVALVMIWRPDTARPGRTRP